MCDTPPNRSSLDSLSSAEVTELLRLVELTESNELDCGDCQRKLAEFAEQQLSDKSLDDVLLKVEQHLAVCTECREEYLMLQRVLTELKVGNAS